MGNWEKEGRRSYLCSFALFSVIFSIFTLFYLKARKIT